MQNRTLDFVVFTITLLIISLLIPLPAAAEGESMVTVPTSHVAGLYLPEEYGPTPGSFIDPLEAAVADNTAELRKLRSRLATIDELLIVDKIFQDNMMKILKRLECIEYRQQWLYMAMQGRHADLQVGDPNSIYYWDCEMGQQPFSSHPAQGVTTDEP